MRNVIAILLMFYPFCIAASQQRAPTSATVADEPIERGVTEWGFHTGGGFNTPGGVQHTEYWMINGRWGKVLTHSLGIGLLRGSLEYGVEIVPAMIVSQSTKVLAAGFSPLQLRYCFTSGRHTVPFFEIGGFILPSAGEIPEHTSRFNFLTFGGIGFSQFIQSRNAIQVGVRFQHISNAGIADHNPGINSLYLFMGLSHFR